MKLKSLIAVASLALSSLANAHLVTEYHSTLNDPKPLFVKWDNMIQYKYFEAPIVIDFRASLIYAFYGVDYNDQLSELPVAKWSESSNIFKPYSTNSGWTGNGFENYSKYKGMQLVVMDSFGVNHYDYSITYERVPQYDAPEPASLGILGLGIAGLLAVRKRYGQ